MTKPVFTFVNNEGAKYRVYFGKSNYWYYNKKGKKIVIPTCGTCDDPEIVKKPKIVIDKNMRQKTELATIIEEWIHAYYFDKKEKEVRPLAATLTNFLYQQGWRKTK